MQYEYLSWESVWHDANEFRIRKVHWNVNEVTLTVENVYGYNQTENKMPIQIDEMFGCSAPLEGT